MDKNSVVSQLNRQDIDRRRGYRERLDFYHGRQWLGRERRWEKRLTFNYAKVFIDKVASYLMSGVNFAVDAIDDSAEAETKAQKAEAALHQVYEENNLEQLDLETEIDCAVLGDAGYKVSWDTEAKKVRVTAPAGENISRGYYWGEFKKGHPPIFKASSLSHPPALISCASKAFLSALLEGGLISIHWVGGTGEYKRV